MSKRKICSSGLNPLVTHTQGENNMRKVILLLVIIFGVWAVADRFFNDSWWNNWLYGRSVEVKTYSEAQVNTSQSRLNNARAAKIEDDIRRQREMDNGLGINMVARILSGQGITSAEQGASNLSQCLLWSVVFGVALVWFLLRRRRA